MAIKLIMQGHGNPLSATEKRKLERAVDEENK